MMTFQCNADTAYLPSKTNLQGSANPQICTSASNNGVVYSAACASTLSAYAIRQTLFWFADVANTSATPTLNIDTLGAVTMVRQDGSSLAINDIKAAALYRIWYDGTEYARVEAGLAATSAGGVTTTRGLFASRGSAASPRPAILSTRPTSPTSASATALHGPTILRDNRYRCPRTRHS